MSRQCFHSSILPNGGVHHCLNCDFTAKLGRIVFTVSSFETSFLVVEPIHWFGVFLVLFVCLSIYMAFIAARNYPAWKKLLKKAC